MSAVSAFMEALSQAENPQGPPRSDSIRRKSEGPPVNINDQADAATRLLKEVISDCSKGHTDEKWKSPTSISSESSAEYDSDHIQSAIFARQTPSPDFSNAGEPYALTPSFHDGDSVNGLFSDGIDIGHGDSYGLQNSDTEQHVQNDDDYHNHIEIADPPWATKINISPARETIAAEPNHHEPLPYDPNLPAQFYGDPEIQSLASPHVTPETPFFTPHAAFPESMHFTRHDIPPIEPGNFSEGPDEDEISSALSEEQVVAQFSDKAFRKALREVEPTLTRTQQHYAWAKGYQDNQEWTESEAAEIEAQVEDAYTPDPGSPPQPDNDRDVGLGIEPRFRVNWDDGLVNETVERADANGHVTDDPNCPSNYSSLQHLDIFAPHHTPPTPLSARPDVEEREKQLESSFKQAIHALERNNIERIARESEIDEAHIQRAQISSRKRDWGVEYSDKGQEDTGDQDQQTGSWPFNSVEGSAVTDGPVQGFGQLKERTLSSAPAFPPPRRPSSWVDREPPPDSPFGIRKSVEPESPRRFLERESTPAYEDRSPTPSPSSNADTDMIEAPPVDTSEIATPTRKGKTLPTNSTTRSSPEPTARLTRSLRRLSTTASRNQSRDRRRSGSRHRSQAPSPAKVPPVPPLPTTASPAPISVSTKSAEPRASIGGRRKSGIQGTESKVSKINKTAPKSRSVSRKVTVTVKKAVAAEIVRIGNGQGQSKVKEAVKKIEEEEKKAKANGKSKGPQTPPSRRSRRLRGDTPEVEEGV